VHKFKPLRLGLIISTFAFLEASLLANFNLWNLRVEPLLMLIVFLGIFSTKKQIYICAFFCGLLLDVFSILPFGINILIFMLIAFFIQKIPKNFFKEERLTFAVLVFISTFFSGFISFSLAWPYSLNFFRALVNVVLPATFISTLVSPLVFSFFKLVLIKNENK